MQKLLFTDHKTESDVTFNSLDSEANSTHYTFIGGILMKTLKILIISLFTVVFMAHVPAMAEGKSGFTKIFLIINVFTALIIPDLPFLPVVCFRAGADCLIAGGIAARNRPGPSRHCYSLHRLCLSGTLYA